MEINYTRKHLLRLNYLNETLKKATKALDNHRHYLIARFDYDVNAALPIRLV